MMETDGTQTAPDTQAPDSEAPSSAPNDAILARLDEMSQQIGQFQNAPSPRYDGGIADMAYQEGAPAGQPDYPQYQEPQEYQPGQYDPGYVDPAQAEQQAMQQLQGYISQQVQQGVQQAVTPFMQQQKAEALERKYPALADPKTAGEVVQQTAQYAQRLGRPEMARDPELVELVFLAQQARDRAAQETPADGGQGVHLESGGAAPQPVEDDAGDRMLKAWGIDPAAA